MDTQSDPVRLDERKKRILVVEDDKIIRDILMPKLLGEGFDAVNALDGEEALEKLAKEEKFDLILLDMVLPGMDGFSTLAHIKQDPNTRFVPVVILSNLGQNEDVKRGFDLGAAEYLIKAHFTPVEIIERIQKILKEN